MFMMLKRIYAKLQSIEARNEFHVRASVMGDEVLFASMDCSFGTTLQCSIELLIVNAAMS
jgi:hypothetical protein